jgi:hypothetical protein
MSLINKTNIKESIKKITIPNLKNISTEFKIHISSKCKKDEILDIMSNAYDKFDVKSKQKFDDIVQSLNSTKQSKKSLIQSDDKNDLTLNLIDDFKNLQISKIKDDKIINKINKIILEKKEKHKFIKLQIPSESLSSESLENVERAIQYAKKGDSVNFQGIIDKLDIGFRYYLITNIPLDLKIIRGLFLGNSPFIFKSGYHYTQFTTYETKDVPKFSDKEIEKKFDKELEIVYQGKMKGFASDVAIYALFNKNYDLLNKYHDSIQTIMDDKLLEFIEDVFCKSVIEDDYELCKSIFKRMQDCERNKDLKSYLLNLAKFHKKDRMINLFSNCD